MNATSRTAQVTVKNVYGVDKIYPANDVAEIFAKIAGTKTLSNTDLLDMERLGFGIAVIGQPLPVLPY